MKEIEWREIVGFEFGYIVSDIGVVKSIERVITYQMNGVQVTKLFSGRLLKGCKNEKGYLKVPLSKDNKSKSVPVHRIVAMAFIPNPDNKPEVNHKNGIKTDNRVENLE